MLKPIIWRGHVLNNYLIDETGGIWSKRKNIMLIPKITNVGYKSVQLPTPEGRKWINVHRLVAETFIGPIGKGLVINHIDGNKENNYVGNIEITTHKANRIHARDTGLWNSDNAGRAKTPVVGINKISGYMKEWPSITEAALAITGRLASISTIHNVITGRRPSAYGWLWIRS